MVDKLSFRRRATLLVLGAFLVALGGGYIYSAKMDSVITLDDGSVLASAPRMIHTEDPVTGCPPARAANADLFTQTFSLGRTAYVFSSAQIIRNVSGRADLQLFIDGSQYDQTLTYTSSAQWQDANVQWSGTLAAGSHTVSLRSPTANIWGCGSVWGSIDTIISEGG